MRLLALDDLWFDDLNLPERPLLTDRSERLGFAARRREGLNGSHFVRTVPETARWVVLFKCDDDASRDAILAALGGDVAEERRLLAMRDDIASTRVVAYGVPVKVQEIGSLDLVIEFEGMDSLWVDETATETTKAFTSVLDRAMHLDVPGNTRTAPKIILTPQTQRTASAGANAGWRFRRRCTITNNSDKPWFREPCRISMGSTTAAVSAGNMQADGDDVRLWLDGMEIARTLVTWNTAASFVWFIIPALLPGRFMVVDIVYGNGVAVDPPVLAYPDFPPFFLTVSSNAVWQYPADEDSVNNNGRGIWHLSGAVEPITPDFGVPGSWRPVRVVPNPDNTEIGRQLFYDSDGTAEALARFNADRYMEEAIIGGANDYNGVTLYSPLPITKLRAGFTYANDNGLWAINLHYRNSSSEDWVYTSLFSDVFSGTVAPADHTLPSPSHHIAVTVGPQNNWAMNPTTPVDDSITARTDEEWTITRDDSDMAIILGAEEEIYELATELRLGGGGDLTPPYHALLIGNARDESGAGTPRAAVALSQALMIDCADYTHEVFDRVPWTPEDLGDDLALWLKADAISGLIDGANVASWPDSSGNGRHAAQLTASLQPTYQTNEINGLPVVRFDGVDNFLETPTFAGDPVTQPFWVALVVKDIAVTTNDGYFSATSEVFAARQKAALDPSMHAGTADLIFTEFAIAVGTTHVHLYGFDGASSRMRFDGTASSTTGDPGNDQLNGTFVVGTNVNAFANIDLAELLIIKGNPSPANLERLDGYAAHKWGLQANLPASHPYAGHAPVVSGLSAAAESLPAHAVSGIVGWDDNGVTEESPTNDWLPLAPTRTVVPNGTFDADIGGWQAGETTLLILTRSWASLVGGAGAGSLLVSCSGGSAGEFAQTVGSKWFAVNDRESVTLAAWVRTEDADLVPRLQLLWGDADENVIQTDTEGLWTPAINTGYRRVFAARVPHGATQYRIGLLAYANGPATGGNYFDDVTVNDNDLTVNDATMIGGGTLDVRVDLQGRWL